MHHRNTSPTPTSSKPHAPVRVGHPLEAYTFGKIQPQALELEEAVLGAMMIDREAITIVPDYLLPESFYTEIHQEIYRAMLRLVERQDPVDLLTVTNELRRTGQLERAGGAYYLVELTRRVASAANVEYHCRIIQQAYYRRRGIELGTWLTKTGYEDTTDVFQMLDEAETRLSGITNLHQTGQSSDAAQNVLEVMKLIDAAQKSLSEGKTTGVPTGLVELDSITGGWQDSDLVILGARPGMGKTAMLLCTALHCARMSYPVGILSLEMSSAQLMLRNVSILSEVSGNRIKNKLLASHEWDALQKAGTTISQLPIYTDDTPGMSIIQARAVARAWKKKYGIRVLFIDYLQLMTGNPAEKHANREQELASISRKLKALAKELNVPVIAISMLSRAVETRGGSKRPQLSDLRESGSIEADADIVAFLYRPEYYEIYEDETGESLRGVAEVIIAKHRNGPLDTAKVGYQAEFTRFDNLDPHPSLHGSAVANMPINNVNCGNNPADEGRFPDTPPPSKIPRLNERDIPF